MPDINYWLAQKYALLQQQADAGTTNAASGAIQANAQAGALGAAAKVDTTRAGLMPAESAAQIGLQGAQTRLFGQQANIVGPESVARIAGMNADTALVRTNRQSVLQDLERPTFTPSALSNVLGARGYQGYRLGSVLSDDGGGYAVPRRW